MLPQYQSPLLIVQGVIGGTRVLLIVDRIRVAIPGILVPTQPTQRVVVSYIRRVANIKIAMIVRGNLSQRAIQDRGKIQCKKAVADLM